MRDFTEPTEDQIKKSFYELCQTIAALRHPETGCPWDLKQTHVTLRRFMIEEAYEAAEAAQQGGEDLAEELGDVLLQVVLNAQIGMDEAQFSILEVIESIKEKMIRRHPHVFDPKFQGETSETALRGRWSEAKKKEGKSAGKGIFAKIAGKGLPATLEAQKIGEKAAEISFDWHSPSEVFAKLREEVDELETAMTQQTAQDAHEELGDVFFTLSQLARHLGRDLETLGKDANGKFLRRFAKVETLASERAIDIKEANQPELEKLWEEAKKS